MGVYYKILSTLIHLENFNNKKSYFTRFSAAQFLAYSLYKSVSQQEIEDSFKLGYFKEGLFTKGLFSKVWARYKGTTRDRADSWSY